MISGKTHRTYCQHGCSCCWCGVFRSQLLLGADTKSLSVKKSFFIVDILSDGGFTYVGMNLLRAETVTLLLALVHFSVAAEVLRRESVAGLPHFASPEPERQLQECIQQHEIFPAYLSNPEVSISKLRRKAINVLVVDLHDGMRRELATMAKRVFSETFKMDVRILVPESSARWCDFPGLDWWTMCGSEEMEKFLRRAINVPWVAEADLIFFSMPPVLLQLLLPLGKPMVAWITVPPEYGRQNKEAYKGWLSDFRSAASDPSIAIVSTSRYDHMYVRYFYGVDTEIIGLSTPGITSEKNAFDDVERVEHRERERRKRNSPCLRQNGCMSSTLVEKIDTSVSVGLFPKSSWQLPWAKELFSSSLRDLNVSLLDPGALEHYRVAIYLPYMRNTNLFLEIYRSGIPIFTPSLDFLVQLDQAHCLMSNRVYWTNTPEPCDRVYPYSPNELHYSSFPIEGAPAAHAFWLGHSEHFSSEYPGIIEFESEEDLKAKLFQVDFREIHRIMSRQNQKAARTNMAAWTRVITKLLGAIRVDRDGEKRPRTYRPGSHSGPLVSIHGTCAHDLLLESFEKARTQINRRCKVLEIDWEGFPARHSCATWPEVYGKYWPGGP